jgi:hypothetical protein
MRYLLGPVVLFSLTLASLQSSANDEVAFFSLTVNGEDKTLKENDTLELISGDLLIVRSFQASENQGNTKIDLIGFDHKLVKPLRPSKEGNDDSMILIRSDEDLVERFAEGPNKDIYALAAKYGSKTTKSYLKLIPPQLDKVELSINGQPRQVGSGSTLELNKSDRFQITRIFTNVRNNENVVYKIQTSENPRINFRRGSKDLGHIVIKWIK